jgi:hypothetical protein
VPGFSSKMLGVLSSTPRSNICLFLFVPNPYFLILPYYNVVTCKLYLFGRCFF